MNKQRMRISSASAKLEWRTIAITAKDPLVFAKDLQSALQELTDGGFTLTGQMPRGDALIITASRILEPALDGPSELTAPVLRRRIVDVPNARAQGVTTEEVLYHFIEKGVQKQLPFPTLIEALRMVKLHLDSATDVLPVNLTTMGFTRFDPDSFTMLLKMFAEDLQDVR